MSNRKPSQSLSRRLVFLAFLAAILVLSGGCVSVKSMPFETFAKIERGTHALPPECLEVARQDMGVVAWWQENSAKSVVEFWEKMASEYDDFLDRDAAPQILDQRIGQLVERYAEYPDKQSVRVELIESAWPYGLKQCPIGAGYPAGAPIPATFADEGVRAARAWPLWVWGARVPADKFPPNYAGLATLWPAAYAAHREDLLTFWLSVNLTMRRQEAYLRMTQGGEGRVQAGALANREDCPLPILSGFEQRLFDLRGAFGAMPVVVRDMQCFHPLGSGADACPLVRSEVYGLGNAWTSVLFSKAQGVQWLATGRCRPGEPKPGPLALYMQEGIGWLLFPAIGYVRGSVTRYPLVEAKQAGPPQRVASILSLWPLFLYGSGKGLTASDATLDGKAIGVPLLFAYADIGDDRGMHLNVKEVLHFLLYAGVNFENRYRDFTTHLVGLGALWTSHYNGKTADSRSGPLWGLFGWGRSGGHEVIRIFGFPIRTGEQAP